MTTATVTVRWGEVRGWKVELEVELLPGSFATKENRDTSQCPRETIRPGVTVWGREEVACQAWTCPRGEATAGAGLLSKIWGCSWA